MRFFKQGKGIEQQAILNRWICIFAFHIINGGKLAKLDRQTQPQGNSAYKYQIATILGTYALLGQG